MLFFLSMYLFSIIGFFIHFFTQPQNRRTRERVIELLLLYQLIFSVGVTSFLAFIGLTFMDEYIAQYFNWHACPFQQELGNVNLAFGVLGILCIWFRKLFWVATIIGFSVWIFSDGIHHIYHAVFKHNYSTGNIGVSLYTDIFIPIILVILLFFYCRENPDVGFL